MSIYKVINKRKYMPCTGPDLDHARKEGTKAFEEIKRLLENKYQISKEFHFFKKEAEIEYEKMKAAIEELFAVEASESF